MPHTWHQLCPLSSVEWITAVLKIPAHSLGLIIVGAANMRWTKILVQLFQKTAKFRVKGLRTETATAGDARFWISTSTIYPCNANKKLSAPACLGMKFPSLLQPTNVIQVNVQSIWADFTSSHAYVQRFSAGRMPLSYHTILAQTWQTERNSQY